MEEGTQVPRAPAGKADLPASRPACRAAIDHLRGEIDATRRRSRLPTSSARRDVARWTRAGTTGRAPQSATSASRSRRSPAHLQTLPPDRKVAFKDCPIEVLRDEFDDVAWQVALDGAHALHDPRAGV